MGVSFKVSKAGTRYRPKLGQIEDKDNGNGSLSHGSQQGSKEQGNVSLVGEKDTDYLAKPELHSEDFQVSFSVNLFAGGFSVGKATEIFNDVPKKLHPYDRASETLFTAIEYGWLPGDVFDEVPCKYVNGALLCEIRDYRNCSSQRPSTVKSPLIHRVLLRMCMETVVKDMLSLSDDSWSYEDLLEVESRILKALQPELNLNPKPLPEKHPGKPLIKRLNLGVSWAWKKRKLNDQTKPATTAIGHYQSKNSNSVSGPGHSDKSVPCLQQPVSVSVQTLPENNSTCSQFDPLIVSNPLANSCNGSLGKLPTSSAIVSVQKDYLRNCDSDMKKTSSLVRAETDKDETNATQRPIMKKPKQEPIDFYQDQHPGSQGEGVDSGYFYQHLLPGIPAQINSAFKLQWKNNVLYQNTESEKNQHGIQNKEAYPLLSIKGYQQAFAEGIPIQWDAIPASIMKQEPNETDILPMSDVLSFKENYIISMRNNPCNPPSSLLISANTPSTNSLGTGIKHPVVRSLRDEVVDQKRKALQEEASGKQRKNSRFKGFSVRILDALAGTSSVSAANAKNISGGSVNLPPNSEIYGHPLLQRFLKIQGVTQRHQRNDRKRKLDQLLPSKPYSCIIPLVASKLEDDNENGKQKDLIMERTPLSKCFIDNRLNVSKTRILKYMLSPQISHGVGIPKIEGEPQIKMLMTEKIDERTVEGRLLCGREEETDFPPLLTFPNTHIADLFTTQFTSLMGHEGYHLVSDRVVPIPVNAVHSTSSQQPTVTISSATQISGTTLELPSSTLTYGLSPTLPTALTGTMSREQLLPDSLAGGHLLPTVNSQPTLQLPGGNLSEPTLDVTGWVSHGQPHWQEILNKRADLHFQMMQRERLQEQLMQRKLMVGLGASMGGQGTIQFGGGSRGLRNVGICHCGDFLEMEGSTLIKDARQIPCIGDFGQSDNVGSVIPAYSAAFPIVLTTAESRGKTLMKGVEAGVVPRAPTFSDMAHILNKRWPPQPHTSHQKVLKQHQMRLPPQTLAPARLTENASFHLTEVCPQQVGKQPLLSHGSASQLMNRGNMMAGPPQKPETISQTHRSLSISKESFLRNFAEFNKDESSQ